MTTETNAAFEEDLRKTFGERAKEFSEGLRETLRALWEKGRVRGMFVEPVDEDPSSENFSDSLIRHLKDTRSSFEDGTW
jgi:hypothetical protein